MDAEDNKILIKIVEAIVADFRSKAIKSFGDWFGVYGDEPYNEVLEIVESYVNKVSEGKFDEIEHYEKVVMLNSLALYMIEMELDHIPQGKLVNRIFAAYIETIRKYKYIKLGYLKSNGEILISDPQTHEFAQA